MDEHAVVPREAAAGHSRFWTGRIAAEMQGVMQEIGGDGFLIHDPLTRKAITEVTDGLALDFADVYGLAMRVSH